jgi:hypothetical protein
MYSSRCMVVIERGAKIVMRGPVLWMRLCLGFRCSPLDGKIGEPRSTQHAP